MSARFDLSFFAYSQNIDSPGKLHFTIIHQKC